MTKLALTALAAALLVTSTVFAAPMTDEESKAVEAEVMRRITTSTKKLDSEALSKAFVASFYEVDVKVSQGNSSQTVGLQLARVDGKFLDVDSPTTNQSTPWLKKMLRPEFRLKSDEDAKVLEAALDAIYPISTFHNKKSPKEIRHDGNKWIFVRGTFFDDVSGYIVTTDADGAVTAVDYSLRIKK